MTWCVDTGVWGGGLHEQVLGWGLHDSGDRGGRLFCEGHVWV